MSPDLRRVSGIPVLFPWSLFRRMLRGRPPVVRLRDADADAYPFVKTNVPITLLSFESRPLISGGEHPGKHTPGGPTAGEAARLAYGASRVGIGTDMAGSVRVPAHYSGIYTIKTSTQRFPKGETESTTSVLGQEGIAGIHSLMTRTLEDMPWRRFGGLS